MEIKKSTASTKQQVLVVTQLVSQTIKTCNNEE